MPKRETTYKPENGLTEAEIRQLLWKYQQTDKQVALALRELIQLRRMIIR